MKTRLAAAFLLACALAACVQAADAPSANPQTDTAPQLGDLGSTVATVNGKALTRGQLAAMCLALHGQDTLEALIYSEVVRQEAERANVAVTAAEIEIALKERVPAELDNEVRSAGFKDLNDMVAKTGMKPEEMAGVRKAMETQMRPLIVPELLARKLLRAQVSVSDDQVREEFARRSGPRVRIAQVVLRTQAEAEDVLKKAKAGADFAELAKQLSIDRVSAADGGAIAPMAAGSPLADAAFRLKAGEIAPVVETQWGFHVVKLLENLPADTTASFDKAKDKIREELIEREMRMRSQTWLQELAQKADVKRSY